MTNGERYHYLSKDEYKSDINTRSMDITWFIVGTSFVQAIFSNLLEASLNPYEKKNEKKVKLISNL